MYSSGPLHTDEQVQGDLLEPIYNSSVLTQVVVCENCRERWTIEKSGGRVSGKSVRVAHHDDDDDDLYIFKKKSQFVYKMLVGCLGFMAYQPLKAI